VSLALPPGRHEYAFIIEGPAGERWAADPFAALVRDEFDTESSVLVLPGEQRSTS
jgi:1,4-alpha-glucan branching enzyme